MRFRDFFSGIALTTFTAFAMASSVEPQEVQCTSLSTPVFVASLVLPDGLGDVAFGECAVKELLLEVQSVVWLRVYPSQEHLEAGERLVQSSIANSTGSVISMTFPTSEAFLAAILSRKFDDFLNCAAQVYLAPWIFGVYPHDAPFLDLFNRLDKNFWAMSEYGRGMGPLYSYSNARGSIIPTGWPTDGAVDTSTAVFKTILHTTPTATDWRNHFLRYLELPDQTPVRLWWAYGRKDSASVHDFRVLEAVEGKPWIKVAKIIPVNADGSLADGVSKNMGQLLREEAERLLKDPSHKVSSQIAPSSETDARAAGQFSQLMLHIIGARPKKSDDRDESNSSSREEEPVEIIVAPNMGMYEIRGNAATVMHISSIELLGPTGTPQQFNLKQRIFLVAQSIPRHEMRSFLEQCEPAVIATGDQSVAEAILLGRLPLWRPDAKVDQWQNALAAVATGTLDQVVDLGERLRTLLVSSDARQEAQERSKRRSLEVLARVKAQFGDRLDSTQEVLMRAGMFG